jgi:hypothetical protein
LGVFAALLMLGGCHTGAAEPAPEVETTATPSPSPTPVTETLTPTPTLTPSPSLSPSPSPTPVPSPTYEFNPPRVPERLVELEEFEHSEYLLLVRYSIACYTEERLPVWAYSFIGEGIGSPEEGRQLYDSINRIYKKQTPVGSFYEGNDVTRFDISREELLGYLFTRKVVYLSEDGQNILCRSYPHPDERHYEYGWDILFENFKGRSLFHSDVTPSVDQLGSMREEEMNSFDSLTYSYVNSTYRRHTTMNNIPPYVRENEDDWSFSPDGKYYAFCSFNMWQRDGTYYIYDGIGSNYVINPEALPFGNEAYGFYIRNVQTGDTVLYEITELDEEDWSNGAGYMPICWVKKAAIDALLAENEGKGPVE